LQGIVVDESGGGARLLSHTLAEVSERRYQEIPGDVFMQLMP
jgi:hypothetical protein